MKRKPTVTERVHSCSGRAAAMRLLDEAAALVARRVELPPDWKRRLELRVLFGHRLPQR